MVTPRSFSKRPTSLLVRRSMTSTISPSGLPRRSAPVIRVSTRSPCSTLAHLMFGEHKIGSAIVANQKSETVAMALHLSGQQIGARRHQQQASAITHDAARALEFLDFSIERLMLVGRKAKTIGSSSGGSGVRATVSASKIASLLVRFILLFTISFCGRNQRTTSRTTYFI